MAKSGIKHVVSAVPISQTTFVSEEFHALMHGNSFPASPVEKQLFYRNDLHKWYIYNGTSWVELTPIAGAWADITDKPTSPSLEEMATEHEADGTHGAITPTSCTEKYTHPSAPPCQAATDALAGHATAAQITKLDGIEAEAEVNPTTTPTCQAATTALAGHATAAQITKLDGIEAEANKYSHPSAPPCRVATSAQTGHATATQIAKLDGIEAEANKYTHPDPPACRAATAAQTGHATITQISKLEGIEAEANKYTLPANQKIAAITFIIDGGGSAITTGEKGHLRIPFACTIDTWTILADRTGSIVVDIWKDTYYYFPPTDADSITAADPPTISVSTKNHNETPDGWTTAIAAGDILAFNVDSCTTITRVTLSLKVIKT